MMLPPFAMSHRPYPQDGTGRLRCAEDGTYHDVSDVEFRLTCEHEWGSLNNERDEQCKRCHTWRRKP